jgi:hypothetical protein
MPGTQILNMDWVDYDKRKARENKSNTIFSCETEWEVNYLVSKIRKAYPAFTDKTIKQKVTESCQSMTIPRLRNEFVHQVMKKLISN